ncbi:hypothetical protein RYX36_009856 [Vicia faba]
MSLNDHHSALPENRLSGSIPAEIANISTLQILELWNNQLSGNLPPELGNLTQILTLRISDLNGFEYAPLPELNKMTSLKTLDLSFNKLSGTIPSTYAAMNSSNYIFLTGNLLTGLVPPTWRKNTYVGTVSCLSLKCPKPSNSLYINCGGNQAIVNRATYDGDSDSYGPARFHASPTGNWAFSSTGVFIESDILGRTFTPQNISKLTMADAELYMNARISPISLTYYGFCLASGSYTVNLHFAEIMFTDDQTYGSLGRRVFDIYIQGKQMQKDFNIAEEAGGVGKKIIKQFKDVVVSSNTLEIRLYWAGKGTQAVPNKSVYGPLISAISVESDSPPGSISAGVVVGIVVATTVIIILVFGILWWKGCFGKKNSLARELESLDIQTGLFTLRQINAATNHFDISNKIGEGGFGPVYKGCLPNGTLIAVKQLSSKSRQGNREFLNEIGIISALQHPNLVKLCGCCVEGDQLLLIYEYLENNSLARALFGPEEHQIRLDWSTRKKIYVGIARGLAYLHEESRLKVVHRDIKATNVLLDKDLNPKISDFGLAKLDEEDNTHISTRIAGTYGYMAPEYAMHGYLTDKADVYSYGIVALEIVSGRSNTLYQSKEEPFYLLDWVTFLCSPLIM